MFLQLNKINLNFNFLNFKYLDFFINFFFINFFIVIKIFKKTWIPLYLFNINYCLFFKKNLINLNKKIINYLIIINTNNNLKSNNILSINSLKFKKYNLNLNFYKIFILKILNLNFYKIFYLFLILFNFKYLIFNYFYLILSNMKLNLINIYKNLNKINIVLVCNIRLNNSKTLINYNWKLI